MKKSELYPKSFEDMNKEFQYLWNKYSRDDWKAENLGDYCANLEYMVMNYLDRNNELNSKVSNASGIIGDVEIPKEVLKKIEEDKLEDEEEKSPKEESEEIIQDNTITGIPFANRIDSGPSYDELLTYPNGALFDNDVMRNSYYGIYSLQGGAIEKCVKIADIYYNLILDSNNKIY